MAEENLIGALRNALERGETLEEAKITLLNAGYKREEVEKAAVEVEKLKLKFKKEKGIPKPRFKKVPPPPAPRP